MKISMILCSLLVTVVLTRAQKPAAVSVITLLSRVPIPENSASCYAVCTRITNADGTIQIKDNGPAFNGLSGELTGILTGNGGAVGTTGGTGQPTPEQIEQMKQQALARASAYQNGTVPANTTTNRSQPANVQLMQEIGKAQSGMMQVRMLESELSSKMAAIPAAAQPSQGPSCPEVQQGGYAGPTCACTKQRSVDYASHAITAMDQRLQKINELLHHYVPLFNAQFALVDNAEIDGKYGEGISDPATLQMLNSIQRQSLATVTMVLAMANSAWSDGGNQYLKLEDAKNQKCP